MNLFEFDTYQKHISADIFSGHYNFIIGTDEAGRGPAAGGVWAAAVCFKDDIDLKLFEKLDDSKKLAPKTREELYEPIKENSYCSIKAVSVEKIEEINILRASLLAMRYAVLDVMGQIQDKKILTLVDGNKLISNFSYPQKTIIKGDSKSASIAAASILAKVSRDRYMENIDKIYPAYGWKNNKGYLTAWHIKAIKREGITKYHRKSFLKKIITP